MLLPDRYKQNRPTKLSADDALVGFAIRLYLTKHWGSWAEATQKLYLRSAVLICEKWRCNMMHLDELDVVLRAEVSAGNTPKGILSQLIRFMRAVTAFAVRQRLVAHDPLSDARGLLPKLGEWVAWDDEDMAKARAYEGGDRLMRDAVLFVGMTGMRLGDFLSLRPESMAALTYKTKTFTYVQRKTGIAVTLPVSDELYEVWRPLGWAISARQFRHRYELFCKSIGVKRPFHGLRKYCAIKMAEAGCTLPEIMAVTGHASINTAMHYVRQADKFLLAKRAMGRVQQYQDQECEL